MHAVPTIPSVEERSDAGHQWVGAALVGLGIGDTRRAEHAARTGRHVLNKATRIEVLEVYCRRCRIRYGTSSDQLPCTTLIARAG
ncbi:MAG TPA: hypothetical protein VFG72_11625 [Marmoricola sp.]|nr:hypothetical protein [Marmoricola sp.]